MEIDIKEHRFLEHGEHGGHLYGTKLDSVRELIRAGKMCVLDCSPAALKILHNSTEFMPYVIFIAAPGMEQLKSLYDLGRSTGASSRNLTVFLSKVCSYIFIKIVFPYISNLYILFRAPPRFHASNLYATTYLFHCLFYFYSITLVNCCINLMLALLVRPPEFHQVQLEKSQDIGVSRIFI